MNVYKITCFSECGSYFSSYLQSVTVIATDKIEALKLVKAWLKKKGENFIYPADKWDIYEVFNNITSPAVIDSHSNSDY